MKTILKLINPQKAHFKEKLEYTNKQIWEIEFKINTSRKIREDIRLARDRIASGLQSLEESAKLAQGDEKKKLEDKLKEEKETLKRYEAQMDLVDREIVGVEPTEENPGQQGLQHHLESHIELREMVKEYIKTL